jgi:hypothetical protein
LDHCGPDLEIQTPANDHVVDVRLAKRRPDISDAGTTQELDTPCSKRAEWVILCQ